jgi:hypothetical protein
MSSSRTVGRRPKPFPFQGGKAAPQSRIRGRIFYLLGFALRGLRVGAFAIPSLLFAKMAAKEPRAYSLQNHRRWIERHMQPALVFDIWASPFLIHFTVVSVK